MEQDEDPQQSETQQRLQETTARTRIRVLSQTLSDMMERVAQAEAQVEILSDENETLKQRLGVLTTGGSSAPTPVED